jgi:hypothetical protein
MADPPLLDGETPAADAAVDADDVADWEAAP